MLIVGAVAVVLCPIAWWWRVQGIELLLETRCKRYTAPPDEVVYEDDPREAVRLLATGQYDEGHEVPHGYPRSRPFGAYRLTPSLHTPHGGVAGAFFIHGRRAAPDSPLRVVQVGGSWMDGRPDGYALAMSAGSYGPVTFVPFSQMNLVWPKIYFLRVPNGGRLRVFAGQPDPADESHFTIGYELASQPGTIDGWFRHEGRGGVELKVRDGPAVFEAEVK